MNRFLPTMLLAGCLATAASPGDARAAEPPADRIWTDGPILTMNDAAPRAEALAERGGRIVAVGATADVMRLKGRRTKVIDLAGRPLLPGFVDAHGHVMVGGLQALSANMLAPPDGQVTDIASLQRTLREWMQANAATVEKVGLIVGFGYDNTSLAENRHPTRDDLDAVSSDVPLIIVHQSGHIGAMNSKALAVAGLDASSENPAGGVIRRREGGQEPNGVVEETAFFGAVSKLLAKVGPQGFKQFARAGSEMWARYGYTTGDEGRSIPATTELLRQVANEGGLKIDVAAYPDVLIDRDYVEKNVSREYVNRFRVAGGKLTIDGSVQGFTAWRDRPYYKPTGNYPKGYEGYAAATPDQVVEAIDWAYTKEIQLLTHSNGERASDLLIAAHSLGQLRHPAKAGTDRRHVLIHGQLLREDQVDSLGRLGILPSLFPMHTFYWGDLHGRETVGPELVQNISPTGWFTKRGLKFTTHHDAPVAFPDSMRVLAATVTRKARGSGNIIGPDQRVDVPTALKAMTLWPAWQHYEERSKGSLEVGKLADLIILSADPTAVPPETLDQLKVVETIKEGATIFRLDAKEQRRAALMAQPDSTGHSALAAMLQGVAVERELASLPPWSRTPRMRATIAARGHDATCLGPVLADLAASMMAGAAGP
jgi:predicted amidohydrolase YtcJ